MYFASMLQLTMVYARIHFLRLEAELASNSPTLQGLSRQGFTPRIAAQFQLFKISQMNSQPTHDPLRVFIVDDEPSLRDLFSVALLDDSREIFSSADGFTALRMLREMTFDVVILDLSLPDTSGIDILREMRNRGDTTKVILCSAHVDEDSFHAALELDVAAFVSKPVTLLKLRRIVCDVLTNEVGKFGSAEEFACEFGFDLGKETPRRFRES